VHCCCEIVQRPNKASDGWQALNVLLIKKNGMKQAS